jgi:hypothetical protein
MSNMREWPFATEVPPDVPLELPPPEEEVVPVFGEVVEDDICILWMIYLVGVSLSYLVELRSHNL